MQLDAPTPIWERLLTADNILRLMFVLVLAAFLQTLTFELVYDDFSLITMNPWLQSVGGLKQMFTHHSSAFLDGYNPARHYRPMFLAWLWLVQNVFGPSPAWFHLIGIFTHLAACWLAYRVALRLLAGDKTSSALVALLFALHPTKTEAVGWIAAVSESLLAVFLLAGFLSYLNFRRGDRPYRWAALSLACFACALLTKETAVLLPVLIVAYEFYQGPEQGGIIQSPRLAAYFGLSALVLALFLATRGAVLHGAGDGAVPPSFTTVIFTAPLALLLMMRQMVWPVGLSEYYTQFIVTQLSWKYVLVPALGLVLLGIVFWVCARKSPVLKFAAVWFLVLLVPVIVEFRWVQLHDRHLYLPSFGAAIVLVGLVNALAERLNLQKIRVAAMVGLAAVLALISAREVRIWETSVSVFTRAVEVAPKNAEAIELLAETYFTTGSPERAIDVLKNGVKVVPGSTRLTFALAHDLYQSGRYEEARPYYEKVFTLPFDHVIVPAAHFELGMIEWRNRNPLEAEQQLKQAIALAPGVTGYQHALARLQMTTPEPKTNR